MTLLGYPAGRNTSIKLFSHECDLVGIYETSVVVCIKSQQPSGLQNQPIEIKIQLTDISTRLSGNLARNSSDINEGSL